MMALWSENFEKRLIKMIIGLVILVVGVQIFVMGATEALAPFNVNIPVAIILFVVGLFLIYYSLRILTELLKTIKIE